MIEMTNEIGDRKGRGREMNEEERELLEDQHQKTEGRGGERRTSSFEDEREEEEEEEEEEDRMISLISDRQTSNEGIDITNSDKNHLRGFFSYSFASEVFAIVSISLFLPITLEQFARDNGYQYPSHHERCSGSINESTNIQKNFIETESAICEVDLLGIWIDTTSFPLYVFSLSVGIQALVVASMGDSADNPLMRKLLLVCFAAIGSLAGMMFFILDSSSILWPMSAILTIIANVTLGASIVCMNSYIPSLAKSQPNVIQAKKQIISSNSNDLEDDHYKILLSSTITKISSKGIAIGFLAGIIVLCLTLIPINLRDSDTFSLRLAIASSGIWWAIFTVPATIWLPPSNFLIKNQIINPFNPKKSFRQIFSMLKQYNRLKNTIKFLMAWFLLSDAFSTITSTAILFSKTTLNMTPSHLILIGVITPTTGIIGSLIAPIIQTKISYCSNIDGSLKMFKLLIALSCLVPTYVSTSVVFGTNALSTQWEMYILAAIFGMFYGAFQSYARSVYAELIPPGQEAKWYALYSITDKSSSFFGPFIVGLISDHTHNIRYGFLFILFILLFSFPILNQINLSDGKINAEEYSRQEGLYHLSI